MHSETRNVISQIWEWYFGSQWYEVYDFIEYISNSESPAESDVFMAYYNTILERESSGFRFNNGIIAPITNKSEIDKIASAIINLT